MFPEIVEEGVKRNRKLDLMILLMLSWKLYGVFIENLIILNVYVKGWAGVFFLF